MDELTINQLQDVLKLSYPTALAFAQEHGRMNIHERKWMIPAYAVWDKIQERRTIVDEAESQLKHYCLNYHPAKRPDETPA